MGKDQATDSFEALVKTPHMNLRATDPETGKTLLHALVGNSSIVSDPGFPLVPKFTHDALVHSFCQEFKQRYPESFKDFLNQKISTKKPINALDIAVDHGRTWAAKFLIEEGADFEEKIDYWFNGLWSDRYINESVEGDPDGGSPYVYYSESSSFSFIRKVMSWEFERQISPSLKIELLKCCCTFFHEKGKRDYYFTPPRNLMAEAQRLVKRHILPYPKKNFRDSDNNGLLMIVLKMCHNILTSSKYESKPMCRSLRLELLKLLLSGSYPDDIDQADNEGETPLIYAAKHDYDLLYFFLRKTECSVNQQDLQGNTALHYAIIAGGKRRREVLIRHKKINPNIRNKLGQTPLHLTWDRDLIRLLLHAGADPNIKDNEGRTPRDIHEQNDLRLRFLKFITSS